MDTTECMTVKYITALGIIGTVFDLSHARQAQDLPAYSLYQQLEIKGWRWDEQAQLWKQGGQA